MNYRKIAFCSMGAVIMSVLPLAVGVAMRYAPVPDVVKILGVVAMAGVNTMLVVRYLIPWLLKKTRD